MMYSMWRKIWILTLALGLALGTAWVLGGAIAPAYADPGTRYVATSGTDTGNDCSSPITPCLTIQHAVDQANSGDEIRVAAGTYTDINSYGGLSQVVYVNKSVTIRGGYTTSDWNDSDPDTNLTTVDAQSNGRGVYVSGTTATLEGLRITGGDATDLGGASGPGDAGGGLYATGATLTISDCVIYDNTGTTNDKGRGGGAYLLNSTSDLIGNTISGNASTTKGGGGMQGRGGGVAVDGGSAVLSGNDILNNSASAIAKGFGGGVWADANSLNLSDNLIQSNVAGGGHNGEGGGVHSDGGVFTGNRILSNTGSTSRDGYGGGLYLTGSPEVNGNTIRGNVASTAGDGFGGGIYAEGWSMVLTNNVVAENQARGTGYGAGIYFSLSDVALDSQLLHNTIASNTGGDGSGVYVMQAGTTSGDAVLTNNIVASHSVGVMVLTGSAASLDSNLWWNNTSDWSGGGTITRIRDYWGDPDFVGSGDYHIGTDSYAIDRGVDAGVTTDIDGETRPAGNAPDLGADEYPLSLRKTAEDLNGAPLFVGDQIRYVITVTNYDSDPLTGVMVTDTLPAGVEFVSATPSGYTGPNPLVWNVGTIAGDAVWTATIMVRVDGSESSIGGNVASMTSDQTGDEETNPVSPPGGGGVEEGLAFTKTAEDVNGPPLYVDDLIQYVITATNESTTTTMTGVTVTDTLPSGVEFVSATPGGYAGPNPLVWSVGALDPTEVWVATITVRVDGSEDPIGANVASIGSDQEGEQETDPVLPPGGGDLAEDLSIVKVAEDLNGAPLYVGDQIEYTITVTNESAATTGVVVTDTLPAGVGFISATPSGYSGPNPLVWDVGDLGVGEVWTATLTVEVDGTADPLAGNVASASSDQVSQQDSDPVGAWDVENALGIAKTAEDLDGAPLYVGDQIEYTIVVTNDGATTTGVMVSDPLPDGVEFVSADPDIDFGPDPLVWDVGTLDPSEVWTTTVTVEVDGTADPLGGNVASASSDQVSQQDSDPVGAWDVENALSVVKTAEDLNGAPLYVGDQVEYVITVTNEGAVTTGLTVTDALPAGVELFSLDPVPDSTDPLVWDVGDLRVGGVWTATVTVEVDGTVDPLTGNVASASSDQVSEEQSDPVGAWDVENDLSVSKAAEDLNGAPLYVGDKIEYTIVVTNEGAATTGVVVTDGLPDGVQCVSSNPVPDSTDPLVWDVGDLGVGGVWTATVTVEVDGTVDPLTGNVASASSDQVNEEQSDPVGAWDVENALGIVKTAEDLNGAPLYVGDQIEYVITVTNEGAATTGVVVTDALPAGVELFSSNPVPVSTDPLVWDVGGLGVGGVWTATVTAEVDGTADPLTGNVASASSDQVSQQDSDPVGAWDVENALSVVKTAEDLNGSSLYVGDQIEYVITVTNEGATTTGVVVTDTVPAGVQFISATPSGYSGPNPLVWNVGALDPSEVWTATVTVEVDGTVDPLSGNVASASSDQVGEEESDPAGAWDVESALGITKTAEDLNGAPLYVGDQIEYEITVANEGAATTGVVVTDTLPAGVQFISATPSGYTGPDPVTWNVGDLGVGGVWTATVTVEVDGSEDALSGNVASASSDQVSEEQSDPAGAWDVERALTIVKTAEDLNGSPLYPGDYINYQITVTNNGTGDMTGVVVTDTLPAEVELVGAMPSGYSGPNPLVWNLGTVGGGEVWTATITVWVSGDLSPIGGNVAAVTSDREGQVETDPVLPLGGGEVKPGLVITKSAEDVGGPPLYYYDTVQYVITVTNQSAEATMTGVTVTDTLPSGLQFVSATPSGSTGPNPLVWNVGSLGPGQVWVATIMAKASGGPIGANFAILTSDQQNEQVTDPVWPGSGRSPSPELRELYLPLVGKTF